MLIKQAMSAFFLQSFRRTVIFLGSPVPELTIVPVPGCRAPF